MAALVRERVESASMAGDQSVYGLTGDLAGILEGSRHAASNVRRKFSRR